MRVLIGEADFLKKRLGLEDLSTLEAWQLSNADQPLPPATVYLDLSGCFAKYRPSNTSSDAWWIVHAPAYTLNELPPQTIRLNAWPGFAAGPDWEMAWEGEKAKQIATEICSLLNKNPIRVPDQIGFVGARILASIIQEAVMLSDEGAASKTDIDLAMKLGTNYPRGPFEWAEAIGWEDVREVVERMRDEG
jgi:3-hydroxybutyryl-CoA dehydrogenase